MTCLSYLKSQRDQLGEVAGISEVFTDRVSATQEIISPTIITDLLVAKTIKADQIEGLAIYTEKLLTLEDLSSRIAQLEQTQESSEELNLSHIFDDLEAKGALIVWGRTEFKN